MNETAYSLSSSRTLWDLVARRADLTPTARSSSRTTGP